MTEIAPEQPEGPVHYRKLPEILCGIDPPDGLQVSDDWQHVTCKNCLRRKPKN